MRRPARQGIVVLGGCLVLAGCASYAPRPLPAAPQETSLPAAAERASRGVGHPGLRPLPIDLARPLTPEQLSVLAVITSPALKAARARAGVAEAQAFEAGLLPDPQVSVSLDRPLSAPGAVDALAASLGYDLSSLYLRGPALAAARARTGQARLDVAWQEWQAAIQARVLAARLAGLTRAAILTRRSQADADEILARTLRAVGRGDLNANDLEARRIAAVDAADRARAAERDLAAARLELNKLLGLTPDVPLDIVLDGYANRQAPDATQLFQIARESRLDLRALETGYAAQEAALRGAVLAQFPKLTLTANAARDTGGVRTIGPALTFDLPIFNRNRGAIAVATATREQLRAEYGQRLSELRADLAILASGYSITQRQRADLLRQIPALRSQVAGFERAAARGDLPDVTARTARQTLTDKEIALAALEQTLAEQWAGLEMSAGRTLEAQP